MDRRIHYFQEVVSTQSLNDGNDFAETAINNINVDADQAGIFQGGGTSEKSGTPDFSVDVVTPLIAYDQLGRRIRMPGTGGVENVDLTSDSAANPTVPPATQFRWVSLFIKYTTAESEPKTDGKGDVIQTLRQDSYELLIVSGAAAATEPAAVKPSLLSDGLLIADVIRRDAGSQTEILDADIDQTRTEFTYRLTTTNLAINVGTQKLALQALLTELQNHIDTGSGFHQATGIIFTPELSSWSDTSKLVATNVQTAVDEIVTDLAATTGAQKIGTLALPGPWADGTAGPGGGLNIIGTISSVISQLANKVNATDAGANKVGFFTSAGWADGTWLLSLNVREAIDEIVDTLAENNTGDDGAKKIGSDATLSDVTGADIRAQLDNLADDWVKNSRTETITGEKTFSNEVDFTDLVDFTAVVQFAGGGNTIDVDASQTFGVELTDTGLRVNDSKLELKGTVGSDDCRRVLFTSTVISGNRGVFEFTGGYIAATGGGWTSPSIFDGLLSDDNSVVHIYFDMITVREGSEGDARTRTTVRSFSRGTGAASIALLDEADLLDLPAGSGAGTADLILDTTAGGDCKLTGTNNTGVNVRVSVYVRVMRVDT